MTPKFVAALLTALIACAPAPGRPGGGKGSSGKGGGHAPPAKEGGTHEHATPAPRATPPPAPRKTPPAGPTHLPRTSPPPGPRWHARPIPAPSRPQSPAPYDVPPGDPGATDGEPLADAPDTRAATVTDDTPRSPPVGAVAGPTASQWGQTSGERGTAPAAAGGGAGGLVCAVGAVSLVYFVPSLVAVLRGHPHAAPITVLNAAAGWTVVGWVIALAWAYTAPARRRRGGRPPHRSGAGRPVARRVR